MYLVFIKGNNHNAWRRYYLIRTHVITLIVHCATIYYGYHMLVPSAFIRGELIYVHQFGLKESQDRRLKFQKLVIDTSTKSSHLCLTVRSVWENAVILHCDHNAIYDRVSENSYAQRTCMHSMQAQASFGVRRGRPDAIEMLIVPTAAVVADWNLAGAPWERKWIRYFRIWSGQKTCFSWCKPHITHPFILTDVGHFPAYNKD